MNKMRFIETIRIEDGHFCNLELHNQRVIRTSKNHFGKAFGLDLSKAHIPLEMRKGLVKCRILYSDCIENITFDPYKFRKINSLSIIQDNDIDYSYKSENREPLQNLLSMKGDSDEILIVKNGYITDTSFSNVVLQKGNTFFTPSTPLLAGVKRRWLIDNNEIEETDIRPEDLSTYSRLYLINAMINLEDNISIPVRQIKG